MKQQIYPRDQNTKRSSTSSLAIKCFAINFSRKFFISTIIVLLVVAQQQRVLSVNALTLTTNHELQSSNSSSSGDSSAAPDPDLQLQQQQQQQSADQISNADKPHPEQHKPERAIKQSSSATTTATNLQDGDELEDEQLGRAASGGGGLSAQAQKKLIISRYRLRGNKLDKTPSSRQLANYSQPFDLAPMPAPSNHYHTQQSLARALNGFAHNPDPPGSYTYLTAASQRAASLHPAATGTEGVIVNGGNSGGGGINSGNLATGTVSVLPDEHAGSSYNQDSALDYTPPLQHAYNAAARQLYPTPSVASRLRVPPPSAAASDLTALPYIMASPTSLGSYGADLFGPGNGLNLDHHAIHDYYDPSFGYSSSGNHSDPLYSSSYLPTTSSLHHHGSAASNLHSLSDLGSLPYGGSGIGRSRWSWPWSDTNTGSLTSATFKKHRLQHNYHHHHMPMMHHHKDYDHLNHHHHHHEDQDHLMPKWEHGISVGEIACVAVAVVLGIIILGSPFFLLFLMLFNGGNLFGATQMGLLAPAAVPVGGPTAAAAGRRRKRSIVMADGGQDSNRVATAAASMAEQLLLNNKEELEKLKELDLPVMGEYLFQKVSPFLEPEKLMRTFARLMEVKDDVERIVSKLNLQDQSVHQFFEIDREKQQAEKKDQVKTAQKQQQQQRSSKNQQHVEMRRKK